MVSLVTRTVLTLVMTAVATSEETVHTAQGRLRGSEHQGYVSYLGVPYGTITNVEGRFKMAGLAPSWSEVRPSQRDDCSPSSEQAACLQLDVHVPAAAGRRARAQPPPLPVLAWVRGGAGHFPPGHLVRQGIVVIVISHRLGPLGFMCSMTEMNPGNAGVKDVVIALRWIRDNIVAFGGNPGRVVVAGQGFGAAMVEALLLSPMGRGLVHGAILQSGTIFSPGAFNYDAQERATLLLKSIQNDYKDPEVLLTNTSAATLGTKAAELRLPYFSFGMCAEKPFTEQEQLLSPPPDELLNDIRREIPLVIGYNSDEAYIFLEHVMQPTVIHNILRNVSVLLPVELNFLNEGEISQVVQQVKATYFSKGITLSSVLALYRDAYFVSHIYRSVSAHVAPGAQVYLYQFCHAGAAGVTPAPGIDKVGAAHSDELAYLFQEDGKQFDGVDGAVQQNLLKLWSNFVKLLEPTPAAAGGALTRWQPATPDAQSWLTIGAQLKVDKFPHEGSSRLWNDIYDKYYYSRH